ncbi:MAG: GNAT family N-acetyltransferase [Candidatus Nanopelagicales bacterium]
MIRVRPASANEVRGVQMQVLRPHGALPGDRPHPVSWRHLAAEVDGQVVGAVSVGPARWERADLTPLPRPHWQLRSMAVLTAYRGGAGARLLSAAVATARESGAGALWAAARIEALGLYLRGGWQAVGGPWDKPGIGPHRYVVLPLRARPPSEPRA